MPREPSSTSTLAKEWRKESSPRPERIWRPWKRTRRLESILLSARQKRRVTSIENMNFELMKNSISWATELSVLVKDSCIGCKI